MARLHSNSTVRSVLMRSFALPFLALAVSLAVAFPAAAQSVYEFGGGGIGPASVVSLPVSVPNVANRLLVVGIATPSAVGVSSVTFGTQALTKEIGLSGNGARSEIWLLVAPNVGTTDSVTVTVSGATDVGVTFALFSNVDQAQPSAVQNSGTAPNANTGSATLDFSEPDRLIFSMESIIGPGVSNLEPFAPQVWHFKGATNDHLTVGMGTLPSDENTVTVRWDWQNVGPISGHALTFIDIVSAGPAEPPPANEPPTADAGPDQSALVGELLTFDGSGSTDPETSITTYDWDFGDTNTDTGISVMHAYVTPGVYTATLEVLDDGGLTDEDTAEITIVSVQDSIDSVIDAIDDLPLNNGLKSALNGKMENALAKYDAGMYQAAINILNAFINQVEDLRGIHLTNAEADALVAAAQALIDNIMATLAASAFVVRAPDLPDIDSFSFQQNPGQTSLHQNVPNPFNPVTTIFFSLDRGQYVSLSIYDISGRLVRTLVDDVMRAGDHSEVWNGRDGNGNTVATGIYFYRLVVGEKSFTRKAHLLK